MSTRLSKPMRFLYQSLEVAGGFALLAVAFVYLLRFDVESLAKVCIPVLVIFFGFTSLLYNRTRAFEQGRHRRRSLYAAERALQATLFALIAVLMVAVMSGLFAYFGFSPNGPIGAKNLWLLLFFVPYLFLQTGYMLFLRALRSVSHEFLRRVSPRELRSRVM